MKWLATWPSSLKLCTAASGWPIFMAVCGNQHRLPWLWFGLRYAVYDGTEQIGFSVPAGYWL